MPNRNRVIYQAESLFAGPAPATGLHFITPATWGDREHDEWYVGNTNSGVNLIKQLYRIQNADYSFSIPRRDVLQYGNLDAIDRIILDSPTVNLNFGYLVNSVTNEHTLGIRTSSGTPVNAFQLITSAADLSAGRPSQMDRNYFILTGPDGSDANATANNTLISVIGIGNGFITSYNQTAAVGDFPTASVSVEGLNMKWDSYTTSMLAQPATATGLVKIPSVSPVDGTASTGLYDLPRPVTNPTGMGSQNYSVLRPGDITISFNNFDPGGVKISDAKIQSYNIAVNLSRTELRKLGNKYAFSREVETPITANLTIEAILGDLTTGNLTEIINNNQKYNIEIKLNKPNSPQIAVGHLFSGATLDSQSFSSSIGSNKTVSLAFSTQIGGEGLWAISGIQQMDTNQP